MSRWKSRVQVPSPALWMAARTENGLVGSEVGDSLAGSTPAPSAQYWLCASARATDRPTIAFVSGRESSSMRFDVLPVLRHRDSNTLPC